MPEKYVLQQVDSLNKALSKRVLGTSLTESIAPNADVVGDSSSATEQQGQAVDAAKKLLVRCA